MIRPTQMRATIALGFATISFPFSEGDLGQISIAG
jgi:hypothetical protein